ncbi:MAG: universal stress protein [Parasphingorhabdus sp.]|nr:universal stress protein [Parasphingorhabdus sp.]
MGISAIDNTTQEEMMMQSILLDVQDDDGLEARFQCALDLARSFDGHIHCVQPVPLGDYIGHEAFGSSFVVANIAEDMTERADEVRKTLETDFENEGVKWDFVRHHTDARTAISTDAYLNDIVVMSRPPHEKKQPLELSMIGDVVMTSPVPVLVVPEAQRQFDIAGTAMVAWNSSFESANALRKALPMLKCAKDVLVVSIESRKDIKRHDYFPSVAASEYLSRHGVASELLAEPVDEKDVQDALALIAAVRGAKYLVMGAYGHSRARQYFFGGVTRGMLRDMPLPLLLSH